MKLRILILLFFFICVTSSSFAVVDTKERVQSERIQNSKKENFSKKKNIKKRKFRLRDLFQWKKKIKKARQIEKRKVPPSAGWSLTFALLGILCLGIPFQYIGFVLFLGLEIAALILGIIGLKKIDRDLEKWKGKGIAIVGILIPIIIFIWLIALLSWVLKNP